MENKYKIIDTHAHYDDEAFDEDREEVLKQIKEAGVDADDVEMLEDLVLSAVNEALKKAEEASSNQMGKLTGGLNIPGLF